jgi:hypothetical protein
MQVWALWALRFSHVTEDLVRASEANTKKSFSSLLSAHTIGMVLLVVCFYLSTAEYVVGDGWKGGSLEQSTFDRIHVGGMNRQRKSI